MKKLIREFMMDCPMCDKVHMIKEYEDITTDIIKDEHIKKNIIIVKTHPMKKIFLLMGGF